MLDWKPEYIALLSRYYRENVLKVATEKGYLKANGAIGRAAHVRPWEGETIERVVEGWIVGIGRPSAVQGERLLRWAGRVEWWEWRDEMDGRPDGRWVRVSLAGKLHELIQESKTN